MKPVAYMRPSVEGYDSAFRDANTVETSTGGDWSEWVPLYTANQLREAQVAVLRDAAEWFEAYGNKGFSVINLCRMADELEKQK